MKNEIWRNRRKSDMWHIKKENPYNDPNYWYAFGYLAALYESIVHPFNLQARNEHAYRMGLADGQGDLYET